MEIFILFSVVITLVAFFSYINVRLFKLPSGIILMVMGILVSITLIIVGKISPVFTEDIKKQISLINFSEFLLGILLSFLLFAGSLHVKYDLLKKSGKSILSFATVGVLLSTVIMGGAVHYLLAFFGIEVPFIACFLFGAVVSPTDPIAVLGILKKANISESIGIKIVGESLFNDGVGVVVFVTIFQIMQQGIENITVFSVATLFAQEALGGVIIGLCIGYIGYKLMKSIDHFQTEILISLAMVMGGYSLCHAIHVSGPLAMVVAGLFTGNKSSREAMSDKTRDYLEKFWEITDEILNAVLFMLMGLQLAVINFDVKYLFIGLITAIILLVVRYISLWIPTHLFMFKKTLEKKTLVIMTWGGLRGGISIALALSLPVDEYKNIFVTVTFAIVLFSILVQGLTIGKLVMKLK